MFFALGLNHFPRVVMLDLILEILLVASEFPMFELLMTALTGAIIVFASG